ncbi:MAG: sigma-70 family RNA polymerase sigma factor [Gemmatimonadetes bacterium]|nr:sigma-70 family RNA polymerase sigma factor [Gemmatimonadota bacterium]
MSPGTAPPSPAFDEALVSAIPALYRFARYLARDDTRADDLVQETYARAVAHRDQFALGTDCRAWLFKICHNVFRRGESRDERESAEDDAKLEALAQAGWYAGRQMMDPSGAMFERADLGDAIERALARLPEEYRTAVVLVDLEDQAYADAAAILQVPVGTVRSRLFRARRLLQQDLVAYAQDAGLLPPPKGARA